MFIILLFAFCSFLFLFRCCQFICTFEFECHLGIFLLSFARITDVIKFDFWFWTCIIKTSNIRSIMITEEGEIFKRYTLILNRTLFSMALLFFFNWSRFKRERSSAKKSTIQLIVICISEDLKSIWFILAISLKELCYWQYLVVTITITSFFYIVEHQVSHELLCCLKLFGKSIR